MLLFWNTLPNVSGDTSILASLNLRHNIDGQLGYSFAYFVSSGIACSKPHVNQVQW